MTLREITETIVAYADAKLGGRRYVNITAWGTRCAGDETTPTYTYFVAIDDGPDGRSAKAVSIAETADPDLLVPLARAGIDRLAAGLPVEEPSSGELEL